MFESKSRILVIDDFKTMRKIITNVLKSLNLENVVESEDAADALPIIESAKQSSQPFDLIISDWNMPKMKGIELLKKVRENPALANTPFLLVTAEAEQGNIVEAVKLGVSGYIVKPFSPAVLSEKLEAIYKKHKAA